MPTTLLILSYLAKAAGFVAALNAIPFVSSSAGVIIFFSASLLKDTVDRIGDFLDNGKSDWRPGQAQGHSASAPVSRGEGL